MLLQKSTMPWQAHDIAPVAPDVRMSSKDLDGLRFSQAAAQAAPDEIHQVVAVVHVGQNHHSILATQTMWPSSFWGNHNKLGMTWYD